MENSTKRRPSARLQGRKVVRLEADGTTHRRDCECPRCDAGFAPSELERRLARRRGAVKSGVLAASRDLARQHEKARLRQMDLIAYFEQSNAAVDAEVKRLRDLRERSMADRRLDHLLRLRNAGIPLADALLEVERIMPSGPASALERDRADNDNAFGNAPA